MERWLAIVVVVCGCSTSAPLGMGDGGADAGFDAGQTVDTGHDAGTDAGQDSGIAPGCECVIGPCCDGCHIRAAGYVCDSVFVGSSCNTSGNCGAGIRVARQIFNDRWCDGAATACPSIPHQRIVDADCEFPDGPSGAYLQYGRCSTVGGAHCVNGPSCGSEF